MADTPVLSHRAIVHVFNGHEIIKNKLILLYIYSNYIFFSTNEWKTMWKKMGHEDGDMVEFRE